MNILVIGGSYFLGKCFVKLAMKDHHVTVFNRGNRPLNFAEVTEIYGDRHNRMELSALKGFRFDAVVDFCAYQENDIKIIFQELDAAFNHYIFVSTCDVYERGMNVMLNETAPFETRDFGGEAGSYILGKVALERELVECASGYHVNYTSFRPVFIYGPDNYAPREGIYFNWIEKAGQILHPMDATGEFQMIYVEDVARAIRNVIGNPTGYNQAYNLASGQIETYDSFASALSESVAVPFERVPVTVQMIKERAIPLPFPLERKESNWYDATKAKELMNQYTRLVDGLKKTAGSLGL